MAAGRPSSRITRERWKLIIGTENRSVNSIKLRTEVNCTPCKTGDGDKTRRRSGGGARRHTAVTVVHGRMRETRVHFFGR